MAVAICLFLASLCVIHVVRPQSSAFALEMRSSPSLSLALQRREKERFRKIDAKRGGGGFV